MVDGKRWPVAEREVWPWWFVALNRVAVAVVLGAVALAIAAAASWVARADDASYLDGLAAAGVAMNPLNPQSAMLQKGDAACRLLRSGVPPDQVAGQLGANGWFWNQRIVEVAQRELCPGASR